MVIKFLDKKIGSGARVKSNTRANVNEVLAQELWLKVEKYMQGLNIIFGLQI